MKLHNLLLTAALFLSAGAAFAGSAVSYNDFTSMTTNQYSGTIDILAFEMNGSGNWKYYLYGNPTETGASLYQRELDVSTANEVLAAKNNEVTAALNSLDLSAADRAMVEKAHVIYKVSIPFDDKAISALGFSGSNPGGHTAFATFTDMETIYSAPANNGMGFSGEELNAGQALVYGKWVGNNNGALFLVSVTAPTTPPVIDDTTPQGNPLPAPITTLLIALAFGGAFMMYRNRKQVNA